MDPSEECNESLDVLVYSMAVAVAVAIRAITLPASPSVVHRSTSDRSE